MKHLEPPNAAIDRRSEPDARAVLADWYEDRGIPCTRLGAALQVVASCGVITVTDAVADDSHDAAADADVTEAYAYAAADAADATDAADAVAYAYAAYAAGDTVRANVTAGVVNGVAAVILTEEIQMRDGLIVVQVTGTYHDYAVTLAGWVRRIRGDEYELLPGHVIIVRVGPHEINGLDRLAAEGPGTSYTCSAPAKTAELLHRLTVRRVKPAIVEAWADVCPRPRDWAE